MDFRPPRADPARLSFVGGSFAAFLMLQHAQRLVDGLGAEAGDVTLAAERPTGPGKKQIPRVSSMLFDLEVLIRIIRSLCSTLAVSCLPHCLVAAGTPAQIFQVCSMALTRTEGKSPGGDRM